MSGGVRCGLSQAVIPDVAKGQRKTGDLGVEVKQDLNACFRRWRDQPDKSESDESSRFGREMS